MLPAANRMRTAADFSETTRRGRKAARGCVVVYVHVPGADERPGRPPLLGLVVGKGVGNSVVRHRASRRIRAALLPEVPGLPEGCRVVVRALPGADRDPLLRDQVHAGVDAALTKATSR